MARAYLYLIFFTLLATFSARGQSTKEILAEIEGKWKLDDNGNVTISKVFDVPKLKKDEIFNRVLNYFIYNYGNGQSVIQAQDKENGLIIGKGLYENVHIGVSISTTYLSAWHIIRVDIKEGRVRVVLSLTGYDKKVTSPDSQSLYSFARIADEQPINKRGYQKKIMTKAFYNTFIKANASINAIGKAVKEGNISKDIENSGW